MLSVLAESVETGDEIIFANAAFCDESFVFTRLTYKNVQRFQNEPLHQSYGLKASQVSNVRASSHKYPHVEKIKNAKNKTQHSATVVHKEQEHNLISSTVSMLSVGGA